jgi:hypothetical protein
VTSNRETARFWLAQIRRQLEDQMTIRLLDAVDGQPTAAKCSICMARWERADELDDTRADAALTDFALYHRALHGGR